MLMLLDFDLLSIVNFFENGESQVDKVKFFKRCLPQILLGPFLHTLSQVLLHSLSLYNSSQLSH